MLIALDSDAPLKQFKYPIVSDEGCGDLNVFALVIFFKP
jgi:hypothetical protein